MILIKMRYRYRTTVSIMNSVYIIYAQIKSKCSTQPRALLPKHLSKQWVHKKNMLKLIKLVNPFCDAYVVAAHVVVFQVDAYSTRVSCSFANFKVEKAFSSRWSLCWTTISFTVIAFA